jgi:hypothetical protein
MSVSPPNFEGELRAAGEMLADARTASDLFKAESMRRGEEIEQLRAALAEETALRKADLEEKDTLLRETASGPKIREMKEKLEAQALELMALRRQAEELEKDRAELIKAEAQMDRALEALRAKVGDAPVYFDDLIRMLEDPEGIIQQMITTARGAESTDLKDALDHNEMAADEIERLKDQLERTQAELAQWRNAYELRASILQAVKELKVPVTPAAIQQAADRLRRVLQPEVKMQISFATPPAPAAAPPSRVHDFVRNSNGTGLCDRCGLPASSHHLVAPKPSPIPPITNRPKCHLIGCTEDAMMIDTAPGERPLGYALTCSAHVAEPLPSEIDFKPERWKKCPHGKVAAREDCTSCNDMPF